MEPKKSTLAALIVARGKPKEGAPKKEADFEGPEAMMNAPDDEGYEEEGLNAATDELMSALKSNDRDAFKAAMKDFIAQY